MDDWDDHIAERFAALDLLDPPDLWLTIEDERERPVPVAPLVRRRRALPVVVAGGVAAAGVAFVVAVTALSTDDPVPSVPATDVPVLSTPSTPSGTASSSTTPTSAAPTDDPRDALQITISETVRSFGELRIEFDLEYRAEGEEILGQWFWLEPTTGEAPPDGFVEGSVFGCLPHAGQLAPLEAEYSVTGGFAAFPDCFEDTNDDGLWDTGTYRLVPGVRSSVTWTLDAPPPGSYRIRSAGWSSDEFVLDLGFAPLGLDPVPDGYTFEWARYTDIEGELYGMVRYEGPTGSPDLVLILRPGSGWLERLPADRKRWTVDGRTVVDDNGGGGGCNPGDCSVGLDWDDGNNVSLSWAAGADGDVLPESATPESLVALVPTITEIEPTEFVEGVLG